MMTTTDKQRAQWAMEYALKCGAQQARLLLYSEHNASFELRDGTVDCLQQATEHGLGITLFVDGRYGYYTTNRLERDELATFIRHGVENTRYLAVDDCRTLPDPLRYYRGGMPDLQLADPCFSALLPDEKVRLARAAAEEVLGKDARIISVETSYSEDEQEFYRLASNGFEGEQHTTCFSLSASVALKGDDGTRPSAFWYDTSLFYDRLPKQGYGTTALQRVLRKLGQRKVPTGRYTLVVDTLVAHRLLVPMVNALYGSALQQQNSFLRDKLGCPVGSRLFTLTDEPHRVGAQGARYFDNEGVATAQRVLFGEGVLRTYFIDTYYARKMEMEPTISSPSLLVLKPGEKVLDGLVADVTHGILVTGFNGGNCNSSTGDFSYGIEGFLIEQGVATQPLCEMNITGNLMELWNSLVAVGCDARPSSSWRIPSLVFEGVSFSGL